MSAVDVHVERRWDRLVIDFFVTRQVLGGRELLQIEPHPVSDHRFSTGPTWVPLPAGTKPEPSYSVDVDVWAAMVAAAEGIVQPTAAGERHLADAIAVRDRVMTLLERLPVPYSLPGYAVDLGPHAPGCGLRFARDDQVADHLALVHREAS